MRKQWSGGGVLRLPEKVVERLSIPGFKPALLVKFGSMFPRQSASFSLREPGNDHGRNFGTQAEAHQEYLTKWQGTPIRTSTPSTDAAAAGVTV